MIKINKDLVESEGLTISQFILLYYINQHKPMIADAKFLLDNGYINCSNIEKFKTYGALPTLKGKNTVSKILNDSKGMVEDEEETLFGTEDIKPEKTTDDTLEKIAQQLKEVFPKGKKDGTNNYWTEGIPLISRRLKLFFKKYGNYSLDVIVDAAKRYVASFNGNYNYMRTLKYFIFKEAVNANREIEGTSELLTYIENKSEDANTPENPDWTSNLK